MDSQAPIILETQNLSRNFGGLRAVDDVNFTLRQGDFHSIIGPNGAGKTTFLNLISGALKPTSGKVIFRGKDITDRPPYRMAHLGIGRSYQITNLFPTLTVYENVRVAAQALGPDNFRVLSNAERFSAYDGIAQKVLERVGLVAFAQVPVMSLPHGDKRRLELALLLAQDTEVLLLDEPTAGLATEQVPGFMALVKEVSDQGGKTIVLVEHNMNVVMRLSDRISVMHQGRLLAEGTPAEISANETVQSAYLGTLYEDFDKSAPAGV
jgi:branched-chain amino acid transport system ATP-binding protein